MRRSLLACLALGTFAAGQPSGYSITSQSAQGGRAPLTVTFDARVPADAQVSWDFGDGAAAEGTSPSHIFYQPGRYQVNVQVSSGGRSLQGVITVQVRSGGPESAAITLVHGGNRVLFSADGSRVYAPSAASWTLDGVKVDGGEARLPDGPHVLRLFLSGKNGPLTKEIRFTTGSVGTSAAFESEVLRLTNDARARGWDCALLRFGGVVRGPLSRSAQLDEAARSQSDAMALHGYFAHVSPIDGSSVGERARTAGYAWTGVAENIAGGQPSPREVVQAWLKSPGHCHNIMGDFAEIGLSYASRPDSELRMYWTQVFGKR